MPITTALITAAGYGSRFFPITKSVQKEMLPVLSRPVLDYLVDDCIAAGITHIILVVQEGDALVTQYYTEQPELRRFFERMGTLSKYEAVENLHKKAHFTFVRQHPDDGYGTAVPVRLAEPYLRKEEAFLFFAGDDFVFHPDGTSEAAELIQVWEKSQAQAVLSCREVPPEETHKYGIVETEERDGIRYMTTFVEKPEQGSVSSCLANTSKYVLSSSIFSYLINQDVNPQSNELYITDTLIALAKDHPVAVHVPRGYCLDCGSVAGWLKANLRVARKDASLWSEIRREIAVLEAEIHE